MPEKNKKVLIIGFFWPYLDGSKRIFSLANYLLEFGWEPIILTAPLKKKPDQKFRVIETDYHCFLGSWVKLFGFNQKSDISDQIQAQTKKSSSLIKSILKFFYYFIRKFLAYPDEHCRWEKPALKAVDQLFKKEKIHGLISVYPHTSHLIAKKIKEKYEIGWIADFPDLWSDNEAYAYGKIRKLLDQRLERKTVCVANELTTTSPVYRQWLKNFHQREDVELITLGFDPKILNAPPVPLTKNFTITYTGIFYPQVREPSKFLQALAELINEKRLDVRDIEVRLYAPAKEYVEKKIKKYNLSKVVKQLGIISFEQCLEKQRESQILLQLNWEDKKMAGRAFSGKLFDYLAAQRPILATGGKNEDVVNGLINQTKAGIFCPQIKDIKKALLDYYLEYKHKGCVSYSGDLNEIKKHSSKEAAKNFAQMLNKMNK